VARLNLYGGLGHRPGFRRGCALIPYPALLPPVCRQRMSKAGSAAATHGDFKLTKRPSAYSGALYARFV
jgi:hypothetical protein